MESQHKQYDPAPTLVQRVNRDFTYQPPNGEQVARMASIRQECKNLAAKILQDTPPSREQSLALTSLEEVSMWCNAAIARNE